MTTYVTDDLFSAIARANNISDCEAEQLAENGIQRALEAANALLIAKALIRLQNLAETQQYINADMFEDLRLGNALGAVFRMGLKNEWGIIYLTSQ